MCAALKECYLSQDSILPVFAWLYVLCLLVWLYGLYLTMSIYLVQNGPDDFEWQWTELVLLEEIIKVLFQHLKYQAGVTAMLKALQSTHDIVVICILTAQSCQDLHLGITKEDDNKHSVKISSFFYYLKSKNIKQGPNCE